MNISFSATTAQIRNRTKDVTRRIGWKHLKPGQRLTAIVKGQGLKKGQKVEPICEIEVVSVRTEKLWDITDDEVSREGFPTFPKYDFMSLFCVMNNCTLDQEVTRIEFKYL